MTGNEIIRCVEAMDEPAHARINAAMAQARRNCDGMTIAECHRPGMMSLRALTKAERAAAITAACELAVIVEGGLATLARPL